MPRTCSTHFREQESRAEGEEDWLKNPWVQDIEPVFFIPGFLSPKKKKPSVARWLFFEANWLRGRDLNPRPLGYAYHYSFRCLKISLWSGLSLHPRLIPFGCLPSLLMSRKSLKTENLSTTEGIDGIQGDAHSQSFRASLPE